MINTDKLNKIKNKKKDVIQPELAPIQKIINNVEKSNSKIEINKLNEEGQIKHNENFTENKTEINNINNSNNINIPDNSKTIKLFDKIISSIQEYLALAKKVDFKLFQILTSYISMDQLMIILEERDCLNICGNIQCDSQLETKGGKKFIFNLQTKEFSRNDIKDYFCSEKCFEEFKSLMLNIAKYDYLLVTSFEPIYVLSRIEDFYPQNRYLKNLSLAAKNFLNLRYKDKDTNILKEKYNKFFIPDLEDYF